MALLLLTEIDDPETWLRDFRHALPEEEIRLWPTDRLDDIDLAIVAQPPPGVLRRIPNLRLICSLWAGVDKLLGDPTLPRDVPLVRLIDPYLTQVMTETVLTHVLSAHRQLHTYRDQQSIAEWRQLPQPMAFERRVGILGLGALGADAALALKRLGFDVAGWSRRPKQLPDITCFHGFEGLAPFLARSEILVSLLPLTQNTRGLLDREVFDRLPHGAVLINVARGAQVVDADLLAALDRGRLSHAVLDVFAEEPLPRRHRFWRHPKVTVLPHVAAPSDPRSVVREVVGTIRRFRAGEPLPGLVDRAAGY